MGAVMVTSLILLTACEMFFFEKNISSNDPFVNFDYLWNEIDRKYSYFELKNIDWEQVKATYRPMLYDSMGEEALFDVMAAMMLELRDDHSNLIAPFNIARYNLALKKPANYHVRTIKEFYLPGGMSTGPFFHGFIADSLVAYIRYSSFSSGFSSQQLNYIIARYENTRGLVFDLRENGGGDLLNVPLLLERFSGEKVQVGYVMSRNGEAHDDFGERKPFYIGTHDSIKYTKPVAVLTDRGSYSATTMFAVATKAIPNITLMGDTTGGGGGMPNGGQLPNGWTYRFTINQFLDMNGNNYAEEGVPPDVVAQFNWSDLSKDEILEKAVEFLLE